MRRSLRVIATVPLLLLLFGCQLSASRLQTSAVGYRADDTTVPASPYQTVRWKAILIAGDNSIPAFDNAIIRLAALLEAEGVDVVASFSAAGASKVAGAAPATHASLDRWASAFRVARGEGCLVFATSHGTVHGLVLAQDRTAAFLEPSRLSGIVSAACGEAPTIIVISACHSGTFIRKSTVTPNRIWLAAARDNRKSFGCRPEASFTYYDGCFLREFVGSKTWEDLQAQVIRCVAAKEAQSRELASEPQAFFGRTMKSLRLPGAR